MPNRRKFVNRLANIFLPRYLLAMDRQHPHAAAIDRLGRERIKSHFNITPRAIQKWRAGGIPRMHWKTVRLLGAVHGVSVAEVPEA